MTWCVSTADSLLAPSIPGLGATCFDADADVLSLRLGAPGVCRDKVQSLSTFGNWTSPQKWYLVVLCFYSIFPLGWSMLKVLSVKLCWAGVV